MQPSTLYTAAKACSKSCLELTGGLFGEEVPSRFGDLSQPRPAINSRQSSSTACIPCGLHFCIVHVGLIVGHWYRAHSTAVDGVNKNLLGVCVVWVSSHIEYKQRVH
jgi:hypothetical protein